MVNGHSGLVPRHQAVATENATEGAAIPRETGSVATSRDDSPTGGSITHDPHPPAGGPPEIADRPVDLGSPRVCASVSIFAAACAWHRRKARTRSWHHLPLTLMVDYAKYRLLNSLT
jgi:hypothetical protein